MTEVVSALDASFLEFETPSAHMHVIGVTVLDPSTASDGFGFATIRRVIETRLLPLERFRQRVHSPLLGVGSPLWQTDRRFDLDWHLRHIALPAPGGGAELQTLVGDIASRHLGRDRPLWEMWVVEGLENGYWALISKIHHTVVDGLSGAAVLAHLLDLEPLPMGISPPTFAAESEPDLLSRVRAAAGRLLQADALALPGRIASSVRGAIDGITTLIEQQTGAVSAALPFTGPHGVLSGAVSPHRAVSFASASLDDLRAIRAAQGGTVNDVVLAACAGSLREWLLHSGREPRRPLIAVVPIATRDPAHAVDLGNQVSIMLTRLPVERPDPLDRLRQVQGETRAAKALNRAVGPRLLQELMAATPTPVFRGAMRFYERLAATNRVAPFANLIISNVPGPTMPLYLGGALVVAVHPLGPILDGTPLNLSVMSQQGRLDIGAIACRETVADLDAITTGFAHAVEELRRVATDRPHAPSHRIASA